MPHSDDGHIYAELGSDGKWIGVNTDDVGQVLGLGSHDVVTLCTSDKVNPYSLIQPQYYRTSSPGTDPCVFSGSSATSLNSDIFCPDSKKSLIAQRRITPDDKTHFPSLSEFNFPTSSPLYVNYALKSYGYFVPYVTHQQAIFALIDLPWLRFYPKDGLWSGNSLTDCWAELQQFDGYVGNADPISPDVGCVIKFGHRISFVPTHPSKSQYERDKIFNFISTSPEQTKGNQGATVNIPAVFGAEAHPGSTSKKYCYGATLFRRETGKYELIASKIAPNRIIQTEGLTGMPVMTAVDMSEYAVTKASYILVPWICEGTPVVKDGKLDLTSNNNLKFYGIRYAEQFQGFVRGFINPTNLIFGERGVLINMPSMSNGLSYNPYYTPHFVWDGGSNVTVEVKVACPVVNAKFTATNFIASLRVEYNGGVTMKDVEFPFFGQMTFNTIGMGPSEMYGNAQSTGKRGISLSGYSNITSVSLNYIQCISTAILDNGLMYSVNIRTGGAAYKPQNYDKIFDKTGKLQPSI